MKKRLRKKLELREFQRTSFPIGLQLAPIELNPDSPDYFYNRLTAFVESKGLYLLGVGDSHTLDVNIFTKYNLLPIPSIKEADRYLLRDWLRLQPEVKRYIIGQRGNGWRFYYH